VFVDESGSNIAMAREYGWAPQGQRAHDDRPFGWGNNVSMVGALGLTGLRTLMTLDGAVDGASFVSFASHFLAPQLRPGDIVLMDNLSAHKVKGVREAIEAAGATLHYLPRYSPDFNPIELCWSKLKACLRTAAARSREELDAAIAAAMACITASNAAGWFSHAGYFYQPA
jgi:transposase